MVLLVECDLQVKVRCIAERVELEVADMTCIDELSFGHVDDLLQSKIFRELKILYQQPRRDLIFDAHYQREDR